MSDNKTNDLSKKTKPRVKRWQGDPPLVRAVYEDRSDDAAPIKALLRDGTDPDAASPHGETPAGTAFRLSKWAILAALYDHAADLERFGWGPLHRDVLFGAVTRATPASTDDLLARDAQGLTPFLLACRAGKIGAMRVLLTRTPEAGLAPVGDGPTALHLAAYCGDAECVGFLISKGFDVNATHDFGTTPLLTAIERDYAEWGNFAAVRALLEAGANPFLAQNLSAANAARGMTDSPLDDDYGPSLSTPIDATENPEILRLLVAHGVPLHQVASESLGPMIGADLIPQQHIAPADFPALARPRFGIANPEPCANPFYIDQIRSGKGAYSAARDILGDDAPHPSPVWSVDRFGRSVTPLADGRFVLIGGEHEDHYDEDFYIYNDVTVLDGEGGVAHYLYPREVFPPTDFHTATLLNDHILLIGSLSYPAQRRDGETQVMRLTLSDFSMHPVATGGDNPGWLHRHSAALRDDEIVVSGGKLEPGYRDLKGRFALHLRSLQWRRLD